MFQNIIVLIHSERRSWLVLSSLNVVLSLSCSTLLHLHHIGFPMNSAEVILSVNRSRFGLQSRNPKVTSLGTNLPEIDVAFLLSYLEWGHLWFANILSVLRTAKMKGPAKSENISAFIFVLDSLIRWRKSICSLERAGFSLPPLHKGPNKWKTHAT